MFWRKINNKKEILKANTFRRAIKEFEADQKISDENINFILEVGRKSPGSFGWEPCKFLVIQNDDIREKLKEPSWGAQKQLDSASYFVILLARKAVDMKPNSDYLKFKSFEVDNLPEDVHQMKVDFFTQFQEKEFDLTDDRKLFDWASKQLYIPLANMMTAAAEIGIDSCPIEGFDRAKVEEILKENNIVDTDHFGVAVMAAFGYRKADSPFPQVRQTAEQVIKWVN